MKMKKKLLMVMAALVTTLTMSAQTWVGGGIGLGFQSVINGESTVSFGVAPEVGYHFDNNWSVAGEMGYGITHANGMDSHKFYIGPYVRYDFVDNSRLTFFGEYAFHYQYVNQGFGRNGLEMALRPGIAVKLDDRWSLVGKINLLEYGYLNEGDTSTLGFHLTTGLNIGFIYNL